MKLSILQLWNIKKRVAVNECSTTKSERERARVCLSAYELCLQFANFAHQQNAKWQTHEMIE